MRALYLTAEPFDGEHMRVFTSKCMLCGQSGSVIMRSDDLALLAQGVVEGRLIQDILPRMSSGEREQLISGAHESCFDKAFG